MNKEERTRVKDAIENMEYFNSGLDHISGVRIKIVNLRSSYDNWAYDLIEYNEDVESKYRECYIPKSTVQEYLLRQEVNSK